VDGDRWLAGKTSLASLAASHHLASRFSHPVDRLRETRSAQRDARLSALQQVKEFLTRDEEVRRLAQQFLAEKLPAIQANVDDRIKRHGAVRRFYLSAEMKDFASGPLPLEQMGHS